MKKTEKGRTNLPHPKKHSLKQKILIGCLLLILLIGSVGYFIATQHKVTASTQNAHVPILLVPGTNAGINRFDQFIATAKKNSQSRDILKIIVKTNGKYQITNQHVTQSSIRPFIVIAFEDNSEKAVDKQGEWLQGAIEQAQHYYRFKTFDAVGHSNGGLAWTTYLEKTKNSFRTGLRKLVTIGTPYNTTHTKENDDGNTSLSGKDVTTLMQHMIDQNKAIPSSISMLALAGTVTQKAQSDGVVPVQSALASQQIYQPRIKFYTERTITGATAQHSDLPQNKRVIQYVITFLYDKKSPDLSGKKSLKNK